MIEYGSWNENKHECIYTCIVLDHGNNACKERTHFSEECA